MGSVMSAIRDDENEWERLKCEAGISEVDWDVYSNEAAWAKSGFEKLGFTGTRLKLHVKHARETQELARHHSNELEEFTEFTRLKNYSYEKQTKSMAS